MSLLPIHQLPGSSTLSGNIIANGASAATSLKANLTAITAPTVNSDTGAGYSIGSFWVDTVGKQFYFCADNSSGAAVWSSGGSTGKSTRDTITFSNSFSVGANRAIRRTAASWALSQSDTANDSEVTGLMESATGSAFVLVYQGELAWSSHGFTIGQVLYVDPTTAGSLTATEPSVVAQVSKPVAFVLDANTLIVCIMRGSVIGSALVPVSRSINTTAPLTGGGDLSADRTIVLATQAANTVLAGPTTGAAAIPAARALILADLPILTFGQAQLQLVSSSSIKLIPWNGNTIIINSTFQAVPDAGITLANTGLTAATLYYIYAFMNSGTMTLEASATAYATQAGTGVQIKSGDATRTLVGAVYMNAGTPGTFVDSASVRNVATWYNRSIKSLTGAVITATTSSSSYAEISSTGRVNVLVWAGETVDVSSPGYGVNNTNGGNNFLNVGMDGTSTVGAETAFTTVTATANAFYPLSPRISQSPAEGNHYFTPIFKTNGTGTMTASAAQIIGFCRL